VELLFLGKGLLIGFSIAAPVGPIGVLCIRRTLAQGRIAGFLSGLGAATADALYGAVAGFGVTVVSGFLLEQRLWIQLAGGLFLVAMGVRTLRAAPAAAAAEARPRGAGLAAHYLSTFLLTLTNPMTIIAFVGIFAALGIAAGGGSPAAAATLVLGVFLGSSAWWLFLAGGVGLLRDKFDPGRMRWVNRLAGAVLIVFGALALWQAAA
jgi:threonine/homoserine/homoserine lactone efflux protein